MELDIITIDGQAYNFKIIKTTNGNKYDSPLYSILLKPIKNKDASILVYKNIFSYTRGYDQNSNSGEQFYLYTKEWGGAGNGGGQERVCIPYLYGNTKEGVYNNIIEGNYEDYKYEFPRGTKIAKIKEDLKY